MDNELFEDVFPIEHRGDFVATGHVSKCSKSIYGSMILAKPRSPESSTDAIVII